jgi:hypothetical protein
MPTAPVPLTVVSSLNNQSPNYYAQIAIGPNILNQSSKTAGYWFVVVDRSNLNVVYNQLQAAPNTAPAIGKFNTSAYVLIVATLGVGLNNTPQGDLFKFLDLNGGGRQLRRVEQVGSQLNCGSLGTFSYALVGVLGDLNIPGFEASQITNPPTGPILTIQMAPFDINGATVYTPIELSNN